MCGTSHRRRPRRALTDARAPACRALTHMIVFPCRTSADAGAPHSPPCRAVADERAAQCLGSWPNLKKWGGHAFPFPPPSCGGATVGLPTHLQTLTRLYTHPHSSFGGASAGLPTRLQTVTAQPPNAGLPTHHHMRPPLRSGPKEPSQATRRIY
eukprot:351986-Chlamydomonas_euryale.AAC.7